MRSFHLKKILTFSQEFYHVYQNYFNGCGNESPGETKETLFFNGGGGAHPIPPLT